MSARTADVLDRAADVIEANGWLQEDYFDRDQLDGGRGRGDCAVCAHGAINLTIGGNPENDFLPGASEAVGAVLDWLLTSNQIGDALSLAAWNDEPGRTAEQVIKALRGPTAAERGRAT